MLHITPSSNQVNNNYNEWLSLAEVDYISARCLYSVCLPLTFLVSLCAECIEKTLKGYLKHSGVAFDTNHYLGKLLDECVKINSTFFGIQELSQFCDEYGKDKGIGNQVFRYGMHTKKAISGYGADLGKIIDLTDRIYLGVYGIISNGGFFAYTSKLNSLFCDTLFTKIITSTIDQQSIQLIKDYVKVNNKYLEIYLKLALECQGSLSNDDNGEKLDNS